MNYCNEIEGFINYALFKMKNINGGGIRCSCKMCKNKKFIDLNVVMRHLESKGLMEKYLC